MLATGLAFLAILALLLSLGIFLMAARLVANPDLRFVLWNSTFLISFASLLALRRFTTLVVPGHESIRTFPRVFSGVSAIVYMAFLVLAFALTPPAIDFSGSTVYALSALWYAAGFSGPTLRLWRSREVIPSWLSRLFLRSPFALGIPFILLATYELARWVGLLGPSWPLLAPLAAALFFALVTIELFHLLAKVPELPAGDPRRPVPERGGVEERVRRIASRCIADPLTKREFEILGLLLEGFRNQDIAERLGLSPNTVKNHVYSLYQKTGVANRLELMTLGDSQPEA